MRPAEPQYRKEPWTLRQTKTAMLSSVREARQRSEPSPVANCHSGHSHSPSLGRVESEVDAGGQGRYEHYTHLSAASQITWPEVAQAGPGNIPLCWPVFNEPAQLPSQPTHANLILRGRLAAFQLTCGQLGLNPIDLDTTKLDPRSACAFLFHDPHIQIPIAARACLKDL